MAKGVLVPATSQRLDPHRSQTSCWPWPRLVLPTSLLRLWPLPTSRSHKARLLEKLPPCFIWQNTGTIIGLGSTGQETKALQREASCSLPVLGRLAGQTDLPAFAFVRGSEFGVWNHRMEVLYFRRTVQASTGPGPIVWLLKGLHLPGGREWEQGQQRRLLLWLF